MHKHSLAYELAISAGVVLFPVLSILLMYFASSFISSMRKHIYIYSFYFIYLAFFAFFFLFLYYFIYKAVRISWPVLTVGIIEIIIFHFPGFWKTLSFTLYSAIWRHFPYNYFLLEIVCVLYGIIAFIKITKSKNMLKSRE